MFLYDFEKKCSKKLIFIFYKIEKSGKILKEKLTKVVIFHIFFVPFWSNSRGFFPNLFNISEKCIKK